MQKILFYLNILQRGGAERVMANLSSQFVNKGYEVLFVTSYPVKNEYTLDEKIKRIYLEKKEVIQSKIKKNLSRIKKLRAILKREKPEIAIAFMAEPNFRIILAAGFLPTKTIISVRNDPNREYAGRLMKWIARYILPKADGCVFQTENAKKWFPGSLQKKSTIILNPIRNDFYNIKRRPRKGLVVTCGRLEQQKNHRMLINAINSLVKQRVEVRLKIYGDGSLKSELQRFIMKKDLEKVVTLEGQIANIEEALAEAEIFVLSSDYEGMPNALMEAMAVGIPCISTDCPCGGPSTLFEDNNGILVPVGDSNEMAKQLKNMLESEKMRNMYAMRAKKTACLFANDHIFKYWENYIQNIVSS